VHVAECPISSDVLAAGRVRGATTDRFNGERYPSWSGNISSTLIADVRTFMSSGLVDAVISIR